MASIHEVSMAVDGSIDPTQRETFNRASYPHIFKEQQKKNAERREKRKTGKKKTKVVAAKDLGAALGLIG